MSGFHLKYRPNRFSEYIGNSSIVENLLSSYPNWPSTFLISGPSGIGKTTLARLIAGQLECNQINLREVDAGQDRGIDKIRQLIGSTYNRPLIGKTKVFILDECQGLTKEAQEALLKITEEPPKNTYFIFCSTDPQKIIKPLKARCQQGNINLIPLSTKELGQVIKNVADKEDIKLEGEVKEIAKLCIFNADGIPREAVMLFNKFHKYESAELVSKELKNIETHIPEEIWDLVKLLDNQKFSEFLKKFSEMKRGSYESFRITFGNIFKKKLLQSLIQDNEKSVLHYRKILEMFSAPVDNNLGDIELIHRFSTFYLMEK